MTTTTTAATHEVLADLRAGMEAAASGNGPAVMPPLADTIAAARRDLVHHVQRGALERGPEHGMAVLALTSLLDCVLLRLADLERDVPVLDPAVAGTARRLIIDAG